ncbi:LptE family protein [Ornithobacterium rhinotracheale]
MAYKKIIFSLLGLMLLLSLNGCYTFTGSSLDPRIHTANIRKFPNYAPLQNPNLSQGFTNALQLRFEQRTKLTLVNTEDANIIIDGEITDYTVTPTSVVSGDRAAQNRLTITVKVRYENKIQEEKSFSRTFSDYGDFEANQSLVQVQDELTEKIIKRLIDQIFNAIVADW